MWLLGAMGRADVAAIGRPLVPVVTAEGGLGTSEG